MQLEQLCRCTTSPCQIILVDFPIITPYFTIVVFAGISHRATLCPSSIGPRTVITCCPACPRTWMDPPSVFPSRVATLSAGLIWKHSAMKTSWNLKHSVFVKYFCAGRARFNLLTDYLLGRGFL